MKKTLFAMLALAAMLPAMAENWELVNAWVDPYEDILTPPEEYTNPSNYTLYMIEKENTTLSAMAAALADKTYIEFLATSGEGIVFIEYKESVGQLKCCEQAVSEYLQTKFPTTVSAYDIWGVCVYRNKDVVRFQVLPASEHWIHNNWLSYDTEYDPGSGYKSFQPGPIPEPATATLSLLALAGLAARRRRK